MSSSPNTVLMQFLKSSTTSRSSDSSMQQSQESHGVSTICKSLKAKTPSLTLPRRNLKSLTINTTKVSFTGRERTKECRDLARSKVQYRKAHSSDSSQGWFGKQHDWSSDRGTLGNITQMAGVKREPSRTLEGIIEVPIVFFIERRIHADRILHLISRFTKGSYRHSAQHR